MKEVCEEIRQKPISWRILDCRLIFHRDVVGNAYCSFPSSLLCIIPTALAHWSESQKVIKAALRQNKRIISRNPGKHLPHNPRPNIRFFACAYKGGTSVGTVPCPSLPRHLVLHKIHPHHLACDPHPKPRKRMPKLRGGSATSPPTSFLSMTNSGGHPRKLYWPVSSNTTYAYWNSKEIKDTMGWMAYHMPRFLPFSLHVFFFVTSRMKNACQRDLGTLHKIEQAKQAQMTIDLQSDESKECESKKGMT